MSSAVVASQTLLPEDEREIRRIRPCDRKEEETETLGGWHSIEAIFSVRGNNYMLVGTKKRCQ